MGPIQILLLGFRANVPDTGGIAEQLAALSDDGTIRLVDVRRLVKEADDTLVAVAVREFATAGPGGVLGADAALGVGEVGLTEGELAELIGELAFGDTLLLLVIENLWAASLAGALRDAGVVRAQQDYLSPEGLKALGGLLGFRVALGVCRDGRSS